MPCGLPLICGMLWDFVGRICLKHFRFFLKSWKMPNHRNTWSHQTIAIVQKLENTQPQETAKRGCIPHIPSCNRPSGQQAITVYSFITACASVYIHWGGGGNIHDGRVTLVGVGVGVGVKRRSRRTWNHRSSMQRDFEKCRWGFVKRFYFCQQSDIYTGLNFRSSFENERKKNFTKRCVFQLQTWTLNAFHSS